jgi:hypothetical protein
VIRRNVKLASVFLTILMLSITIPYQSVLAAMIGTEAMLDSTRAQQARDDINSLLLREDVQNALMAQGINPIEAKARIDSLSDAEVIRIADEINKLPAGAGEMFSGLAIGPPAWLIAVIIGAVVLIIVGIVWLATTDWEDTDKK